MFDEKRAVVCDPGRSQMAPRPCNRGSAGGDPAPSESGLDEVAQGEGRSRAQGDSRCSRRGFRQKRRAVLESACETGGEYTPKIEWSLERAVVAMTVDRAHFIDAMSRGVTGVTVVTTSGELGDFGQTVSAMCSVSADPPLLLVCINRKSPI